MKKIFHALPMTLIFLISCKSSDKANLKGNNYSLFDRTPVENLAKALRLNDTTLVDLVLDGDSLLNLDYQENKFGSTLLMIAVRNNQYNMCKALLERGADPSIHDTYDGTSAIIDASGINVDSSILELLLRFGANPNDLEQGPRPPESTRRDTPLLNACEDSLEKVRILVKAGANVNYKNEYGVTPLRSSYFQDKLDITLFLLNSGADFNVPLLQRDGRDFYLVELLRELILPLDSQAYRTKMLIVEFLLAKGVDYRKVPTPEFVVDKIKLKYPNKWRDYIERY